MVWLTAVAMQEGDTWGIRWTTPYEQGPYIITDLTVWARMRHNIWYLHPSLGE